MVEHVEMWQDKMGRLEAHGEEYKLAPVFKIHALRMLMVGKTEEYFDLWEADRDPTDAAKTYEELLSRVKDYVRRLKLDSSAKEEIQHGGDPMDVGAVGGWIWEDYEQDGCKGNLEQRRIQRSLGQRRIQRKRQRNLASRWR